MWYDVIHGDLVAVINYYPKDDGYYFGNLNFDPYAIRQDFIIDGGITAMGEEVSNACYFIHLIQI